MTIGPQLVAQVGVFARSSGCLGGQACVKFHTLDADIFAFLFVGSVGIACAFAAAGAWLILPFAGIEMLVLLAAFRYVDRHAADYERIAIDGDKVQVEICEVGRARSHEFNRCWAQLVASRDGGRLALRSHGREVEIGRHRNDDQRLALARELGRQLRGTVTH